MGKDAPGELDGKVALITGAGSGIGKTSAILFAREGAKIVVSDLKEETGRETVDVITAKGGKAFFVKADVSKAAEVEAMVQSCLNQYGTLDVLFNSAGIWLKGDSPVAGMSEDVWNSMVSVHLTGHFLCCKYAIPIMIKNRGGSIINMSSISGLTSSDRHAYSAAKGGILALSRSIAVSYVPYNIRANAICPGPVDTPMIADALADPQRREAYLKATPLAKFAQPEDIAYLALYLASDKSSLVTGTAIPVDGGYVAR